VDQKTLARQILRGNATERGRAVEAARTLGSEYIAPELRAALIRALEGEGQVRAQRYTASLRGEALQPLENPEFIAQVSRVVADLRDPTAIPALIGALGTGSPPARALAAFGEEAVPALVAAVKTPGTIHYVVDDALVALRFMLEGAAPRPLSAAAIDEIRRAVEVRLAGKQVFTTVWDAVDLAIALKDPALRRIVKSLATDRNAVVARGIEDSETIEETQRLAAQRLAGVPPQRRWF
jgi:hypothetical protein